MQLIMILSFVRLTVNSGFCFAQDYKGSTATVNSWQQATAFLIEESTQMWQMWGTLMSSKLRNLIKTKLGPAISLRHLLKSKLVTKFV